MSDKINALLRFLLLGVIIVCLLFLGREYYQTRQQKGRQQELIHIKEKAFTEEETAIDYLVMQSDDNEYYFYRGCEVKAVKEIP